MVAERCAVSGFICTPFRGNEGKAGKIRVDGENEWETGNGKWEMGNGVEVSG